MVRALIEHKKWQQAKTARTEQHGTAGSAGSEGRGDGRQEDQAERAATADTGSRDRGTDGTAVASATAGRSTKDSHNTKRRTSADGSAREVDGHGGLEVECEQRGPRAVTSNDLRERSGNGGSKRAHQQQEHGTRKKERRAAQQSSVDGVGVREVDAMYGTAAEAHGPAGAARTATSPEDGAQEDGRDDADGSQTDSSEMGEVRGVIQNCENTVRVRSTQEWQASLRKRRTNASGEGGEQQRRKRRKASGARVPKVERSGGRAPQMTRLVAVGQVAVQRIEGHSGWVRRRRPERGKRRRQPDHDDG